MYIVYNNRNVAELGADEEESDDPIQFSLQVAGPNGTPYRDVIGVEVDVEEDVVIVGHWPDGEEWVELGRTPLRHFVGDGCGGHHEWVDRKQYLACGQSFMAGQLCSRPAGHVERDGSDHE
jgi:hypothetical protein